MKEKFNKDWKDSKQPRKQRKYAANAPLHLKRKLLSVNLSKDVRAKVKRRNVVARKGDTVKVLRGKFNGKTGKIIQADIKKSKFKVDGLTIKKKDGSSVNVWIRPSNLQIIELNMDDKKRIASINKEKKEQNKIKENKK